MSLNVLGVPANPRWLQRLAEQGDTVKLEQVLHKRGYREGLKGNGQRMAAGTMAPGMQLTATPLNMAPKGLIILVNFSDLSWTKADHAEMDSMINGQNYTRNYTYYDWGSTVHVTASGSAKQFFHDSSFGQYNPQFTVIGPVTVSRGYAYYGSNDSGGDDQHPEEMVAEACQLADQQGVDFTQFDNDGDGDIDFVYIFYAGNQESDGAGDNYIWPHSYELESYYYRTHATVRLDGKRLNKYACSGEIEYMSNMHEGIGTFCHEFSHVLGLPDLYVTDYNATQKTMGNWDILDAGPYNNNGNTPPLYSAYEQFFMGWLTPTVISDTGTYSLQPLTQAQQAYLICAGGSHNLVGNDPNPTTFYLLENRQLSGWDSDLPGHGLMITKIAYNYNKWNDNTVNNTTGQMGVDLIEADGSAPSYSERNPNNGYYGKATDLFPAGATSYNGINGYPIRNIVEHYGVITFTVGNGGSSGGGGGTGSGDCDNYSWTASHSLSAGEELLDDYSWMITAPSGAYFGYEGSQQSRGAQLGSKNNPIREVSLTTSEVSNCLISTVTVSAAQGRDGNSKLSVYINGTRVGQEKSLSSSTEQYTFTNSAQLVGDLEIRITNSQKAAYLKSINIVQTTAVTGVETVDETRQKAEKIWENGRIVILRDGQKYDLFGNPLHRR